MRVSECVGVERRVQDGADYSVIFIFCCITERSGLSFRSACLCVCVCVFLSAAASKGRAALIINCFVINPEAVCLHAADKVALSSPQCESAVAVCCLFFAPC